MHLYHKWWSVLVCSGNSDLHPCVPKSAFCCRKCLSISPLFGAAVALKRLFTSPHNHTKIRTDHWSKFVWVILIISRDLRYPRWKAPNCGIKYAAASIKRANENFHWNIFGLSAFSCIVPGLFWSACCLCLTLLYGRGSRTQGTHVHPPLRQNSEVGVGTFVRILFIWLFRLVA